MLTPNLITIGQRIRWLREQKEMSQASLARQIGIKPPSLSEIELGKSKSPSASTLLRIAAILDANPEWIIHGRGEPFVTAIPADSITEMARVMELLTEEQRATLLAVAKSLAQ